ncbi:MAG: PEGA domain-containing protein, partial [Acidobacteriota bacterium]|nr:PEGA domain-containing protein [Acidobacteriota bacterium]
MSSPAFALAAPQRAPVAPRVIPLDVTEDSLSCFASESERQVRDDAAPPVDTVSLTPDGVSLAIPSPSSGFHPPSPGRRRIVRVPQGAGGGVVAMLGGAFCGIVIGTVVSPIDRPPLRVGRVALTSDPPGIAVLVDGASQGLTPVTAVLPVGAHHVTIGTGTTVRPRLIRVTPGGESSVHVTWATASEARPAAAAVEQAATAVIARPAAPMAPETPQAEPTVPSNVSILVFARSAAASSAARVAAKVPAPAPPRPGPAPTGWLTVRSPFPVRVLYEGADIGSSVDGRLSLPAGTATIFLVNDALEFQVEREVAIAARASRTLDVDPPLGV